MYCRLHCFWIIALIILTTQVAGVSAQEQADVLYIHNFEGRALSGELRRILAEEVKAEIQARSDHRVYTQKDLQDVLQQGQKLESCNLDDASRECVVEFTEAFGVQRSISGSVLTAGSAARVYVKHNLRLRGTVQTCRKRVRKGDEDGLIQAVRLCVGELRIPGLRSARPPEPQCRLDQDCPSGKICQQGVCVVSGPPPSRCRSDQDCPDSHECKGGTCVWVPSDPEKVEIVQFQSDPAGAVVMIDGKLVCSQTPCSKALAVGSYSLNVQKERYLPHDDRIAIRQGMRPVRVKLTPNFGWLNGKPA